MLNFNEYFTVNENYDLLTISFSNFIKESKLIPYQMKFIEEKVSSLKDLLVDKRFIDFTKRNNLTATNIFDSSDYEILVNSRFKFIFLNKEYITKNVQKSIYVVFELDDVKMYYMSDNNYNLIDALTTRKVTCIYKGNDYYYQTNNGAKNWNLLNSNNSNDIMRKQMNGEDIERLSKDNIIKITVTS